MGGRKNTRMICGFSIQRFGRGKRENHLGQGQIQDVAKLLPGWVIESSSLVAPPLTMDHLSTSPLNSWRFYLTKRKIRLASWWTTMTSTFWIWLPPLRLLPWWLSTSMGSAQRVSPAPFLRRSFICQPAMRSANLYELWKVFQLADNRSSLYCFKTSLHFSITIWELVNSEQLNTLTVLPYVRLFAITRSGELRRRWDLLQLLNLWILVLRVFLVFLPILPFRLRWGKRDIYLRKKVINFRRFCSYIPWNLLSDLQTCIFFPLVPLY